MRETYAAADLEQLVKKHRAPRILDCRGFHQSASRRCRGHDFPPPPGLSRRGAEWPARYRRPSGGPPPLGSSQRGDDLQAGLSLSSTALRNSDFSRPVIAPPEQALMSRQARRGRSASWMQGQSSCPVVAPSGRARRRRSAARPDDVGSPGKVPPEARALRGWYA
jgi:hypothetical protein